MWNLGKYISAFYRRNSIPSNWKSLVTSLLVLNFLLLSGCGGPNSDYRTLFKPNLAFSQYRQDVENCKDVTKGSKAVPSNSAPGLSILEMTIFLAVAPPIQSYRDRVTLDGNMANCMFSLGYKQISIEHEDVERMSTLNQMQRFELLRASASRSSAK